jgi:hypothetical protein
LRYDDTEHTEHTLIRQVKDVHVYGLSFDWDREELDCLTITGTTWTAIAAPYLKRGRGQRVEEKEDEDVNWGNAFKKSRVQARRPHVGNARDVLEPRVAPTAAASLASAPLVEPPPDFVEVEEIMVLPGPSCDAESPVQFIADPVLAAEGFFADTDGACGDDIPVAEPGGLATPVADPANPDEPPCSEGDVNKNDSDISSVDSSSDSSSSSSSSSNRLVRARRSTVFGSIGWTIAPIYSNKSGVAIQTGWVCVCGQHWNEGDGLEYKKQLIFGDKMDPEEARLRIKLWLLAGLAMMPRMLWQGRNTSPFSLETSLCQMSSWSTTWHHNPLRRGVGEKLRSSSQIIGCMINVGQAAIFSWPTPRQPTWFMLMACDIDFQRTKPICYNLSRLFLPERTPMWSVCVSVCVCVRGVCVCVRV